MNRFFTTVGVVILSACSPGVDARADHEFVMPHECASDDDCLSGAECENAWCLEDGTCRKGNPTGFDCGTNGMCVEGLCIEVD